MAKSANKSKETSTPVIVALVFFVLTTIGLGVFAYVLYSDQEAKDKAVADAKNDVKTARGETQDAQQIALVHRLFTGLSDGDDLEKASLIKEGDKGFQEYKKIAERFKAKLPQSLKTAGDRAGSAKSELAALNEDITVAEPEVDDKKQLKPPTSNLIDAVVKSLVARAVAAKRTLDDQGSYDSVLSLIRDASTEYKKASKEFKDRSIELPAEFKNKMDAIEKLADNRQQNFQKEVTQSRGENDKLTSAIEELNSKVRRQQEDIKRLTDERNNLAARLAPPDPLQYDEPQGKITKRLGDKIVEIDLGSAQLVLPGLTFSVLPYDFPEKGRQSRVKAIRVPDDRGVYRTIEQFTPKATLEVIKVLGPNLSEARLTSEDSEIRDAVLPGDLLYNAVWRKGQADHVAIVGIFDINGDGSDDIESVVRDLTRMGIPVDAYYDLRTLKWVGKLTDRTRYLIDGYTPTFTTNDPNRDAKTKLITGMTNARDEAKVKGIRSVNFRDFFGKMGYKTRPDVSEDRVNQAISKYIVGVTSMEMPKE